MRPDFAVERWLLEQTGEIGVPTRQWFQVMRDCGNDVRELMHEVHPTACAGEAAFAYVGAYRTPVNVSSHRGAELEDPDGLLQGEGCFMLHVKLRPGSDIDEKAIADLIRSVCVDLKHRIGAA